MKRSHRILLSLLSGVLLSLAWIGFPGWTLFVAFIPLLYLDHFFVENKTDFAGASFWGHAFLTVFIWNCITTWWIFFATPVGMALALIANSFLMSVTLWLAHIARRNFKSNLGYISLMVFWISFEYLHFHWDIEWPLLNLGNGFDNNIKMIQWYEKTGTLGGSLWVLLMNILVFKILISLVQKAPKVKVIILAADIFFWLAVPILVSNYMYYSYAETGEAKNIIIVQPNIDPYHESYDAEAEQEKLTRFATLAIEKVSPETHFIVGPETLFENTRFWNENDTKSNLFLSQLSGFMNSTPNAELVFGVSSYKTYPDKKSATRTSRKSNGTLNGLYYDSFNTAVFLGKKGEPEYYHKSILVPGVEKMPFSNALGFLGDLVINIGGTSGSLGTQDEPTNFVASDGTQIAPVICYESVFGEYVTKYVRKGANLIFIITNDGWWRNTPGYKQHLSFARLRAIETRRSIARSANTGISCFINQRGDIFQATEWWKPASISGTLVANDKITSYVKGGDYLARIAILMSVILLANLVVVIILKRKK